MENYNEVLTALQDTQKHLKSALGSIRSEIKRGNDRWNGVERIVQDRVDDNRKILEKVQ